MRKTTHCALRLGDNLAALHFVRQCALRNPEIDFTHYAFAGYLDQLYPMVSDVLNLTVLPLEDVSEPAANQWVRVPRAEFESVDLWKNSGGWWDALPNHDDYGKTMVAFFHHAAEKLGLESPIWTPRHLLFDYPKLRSTHPISGPFDFLIVNSIPLSGQFQQYSPREFERLAFAIGEKYSFITTQKISRHVPCTTDYGMSVTEIGQLSQNCRAIVMVATGPAWPTFNIWNLETIELRVIAYDFEEVNLAPNSVHVRSVEAIAGVLKERGWL
jgi:hypothetical protein